VPTGQSARAGLSPARPSSSFTAPYGSHLRGVTRRVAPPTPLHPGLTRFPRAVSGECGRKRCSPWPAPFSPQAPPKMALHASSASSILGRGPTPPERARLPGGFAPSPTGLAPLPAEALQRSAGSRACCFSACAGSKTTQDRWLARVLRQPSCCLPPSGERRHPNFAFFEAQYPAHRYPGLRFKPHLAMSPARLRAKMESLSNQEAGVEPLEILLGSNFETHRFSESLRTLENTAWAWSPMLS
jgi:hypothetical protein